MKVDALWMEEPGKITSKLVEIKDEPAYDEVQVEILACGVCAWDCALFKGICNPEPFPFMHGHEGVGIIKKIGAGVSDLKIGDFVVCIEDAHQMIQVQNLKRKSVAALGFTPKNADLPLWVVEPAVCIVNAVTNVPIKPGCSVAIIGAGYMGLLMVQAIAASLVSDLYVFDLEESKLSLARKFGATQTVVSDSAEAQELVKKLVQAGGVDQVIECSGSVQGLETANSLMKQGGILNIFAWHRQPRTINMTPWHQRGYHVFNTAPNFDPHFYELLPYTVNLFRKGVFNQEKLITHTAYYKDAQHLMETAVNKSDGYIKGVVRFQK